MESTRVVLFTCWLNIYSPNTNHSNAEPRVISTYWIFDWNNFYTPSQKIWRNPTGNLVGLFQPTIISNYRKDIFVGTANPALVNTTLCVFEGWGGRHIVTTLSVYKNNLNRMKCLKPIFLLYASCFALFLLQMSFLIQSRLHPEKTISSTEQKKLGDIPFPVVFRICIKPAYNQTFLEEAGYQDTWNFFTG